MAIDQVNLKWVQTYTEPRCNIEDNLVVFKCREMKLCLILPDHWPPRTCLVCVPQPEKYNIGPYLLSSIV